jgi:hypothetical protein
MFIPFCWPFQTQTLSLSIHNMEGGIYKPKHGFNIWAFCRRRKRKRRAWLNISALITRLYSWIKKELIHGNRDAWIELRYKKCWQWKQCVFNILDYLKHDTLSCLKKFIDFCFILEFLKTIVLYLFDFSITFLILNCNSF